MPRKAFFSKQEIIDKALEILRQQGPEAISARSLCKALGCSVSPLFTVYKNMDELFSDLHAAAEKLFENYMADVSDYQPAFKEFGMRLVKFSREEPQLFHYLFLDKNSESVVADRKARECLQNVEGEYDLSEKQGLELYFQMWVFAYGLSALCNKNPQKYSDISYLLSLQFSSVLTFLKSGREVLDITPIKR
ncbi:MAG: TetR/AcrR family transcriptional regulator [Candidatus Cryptobacteroides sp.]